MSLPAVIQTRAGIEDRRRRRLVWLASVLLSVVVLVAAIIFIQRQGLDPGTWLSTVWVLIAAIPLPFVLLALTLKVTEVALNAYAWSISLRAAFPDERITFRQVFGAVQGGVGITSVIPPKFANVLLLGFYRAAYPNLPLTTVLAARAVQGTPSVLLGTMMLLLFGFVTAGSGGEGGFLESLWRFYSEQTVLAVVLTMLIAGLLVILVRRGRAWVRTIGAQIALGGAILRTPRRYALLVAAPTLLAFVLRWSVTGTLLAAFGIPLSWESLLRVNVSHGLARTVQVMPGGFGTTQAFDIVALQGIAPVEVIAAYSLSQSAILLVFNVLCGVLALIWAFGWEWTSRLLRPGSRAKKETPAPVPQASAG